MYVQQEYGGRPEYAHDCRPTKSGRKGVERAKEGGQLMTTIARKFVSVPERTSAATWKAISDLLAYDQNSSAAAELASISGIASSLITREAMNSPIVVYGSGPRVRIYCLYNDDAIEGDDANESPLPFDATHGDWKLSLPCPADDLPWVQRALSTRSCRIFARDMQTTVVEEAEKTSSSEASGEGVDLEGFFNS
jgi:hypothetical protein